MTKIQLAKTAVKTVVGFSVGFVVGNVISNTTNPEKLHQKVEVAVGSSVIGMIVAEHAQTWTDAKVDEVVHWWKTNVIK